MRNSSVLCTPVRTLINANKKKARIAEELRVSAEAANKAANAQNEALQMKIKELDTKIEARELATHGDVSKTFLEEVLSEHLSEVATEKLASLQEEITSLQEEITSLKRVCEQAAEATLSQSLGLLIKDSAWLLALWFQQRLLLLLFLLLLLLLLLLLHRGLICSAMLFVFAISHLGTTSPETSSTTMVLYQPFSPAHNDALVGHHGKTATTPGKQAHRGADDDGGGGGESCGGNEGVVMAVSASTAHAPDPAAASGPTVDSAVDPSEKVQARLLLLFPHDPIPSLVLLAFYIYHLGATSPETTSTAMVLYQPSGVFVSDLIIGASRIANPLLFGSEVVLFYPDPFKPDWGRFFVLRATLFQTVLSIFRRLPPTSLLPSYWRPSLSVELILDQPTDVFTSLERAYLPLALIVSALVVFALVALLTWCVVVLLVANARTPPEDVEERGREVEWGYEGNNGFDSDEERTPDVDAAAATAAAAAAQPPAPTVDDNGFNSDDVRTPTGDAGGAAAAVVAATSHLAAAQSPLLNDGNDFVNDDDGNDDDVNDGRASGALAAVGDKKAFSLNGTPCSWSEFSKENSIIKVPDLEQAAAVSEAFNEGVISDQLSESTIIAGWKLQPGSSSGARKVWICWDLVAAGDAPGTVVMYNKPGSSSYPKRPRFHRPVHRVLSQDLSSLA